MSQENLEQSLRKKLEELQSRLVSIKADAGQEHSPDSEEQAQERENDEVVDAIGDETRQSIREINQALRRLEEGSYGVCESCGQTIAPARLQALPEATRCIECAE
ncbi:TraR/DksA family transcriptional regulator [Chromatocurvus halotolerans]|uniref:TraR/DksA family transcriptional regulator n=1 Tax=Chromatocurvus halotolerans TaxID=1132028 RepID=A0A4R2KEG1_9GAMM|nr:TraR/DksA family transcriptional regulator [Chromatocurvus halotolerans]TCO71394.1 TraR/DksA family transcriptional regulator [Chromatocurvus halotolerans]